MKNYLIFLKPICFLLLISSLCFKSTAQSMQYFHGEFKVNKVLTYLDSLSKFTTYRTSANLYNDSVSSSRSYTAMNCGQVLYNAKPLSYTSQIRTYLDTVERKSNVGIKWSVVGSTSASTFTTTLVDSFPSFNFEASLPNQLDKSKNLCITINNCNYTDEIEITFFDGQYRISVPYYRRINYTSSLNQIVIPKCDLGTLTGYGVHITVSLIKNEYKRFNGKKYKFEKRFDFVKPMALKN
ncbi:MAG: hypothetical protein JNJ41_15160 [Bacteroidia bacterium]|nr:hypothetical protein [Bacteroidia bacterium]